MANEIEILTYSPDGSGFYRVGAQLPPGNSRHIITIEGHDLGSRFSTVDEIIICSSSLVEVYPRIILIDDNGNFNHEKITVKFNTDEFTPTNIYATLGILKGDKEYHLLNYEENKIKKFKRTSNGKKNDFVFEFPQGDQKLSDLFGKYNSENIEETTISSMSQPLTIILEIQEDENYKVINHKQLSSVNLANKFSSPVKFIKSSDFYINSNNIIGNEDVPGLIIFELDIKKTTGYGIPSKSEYKIDFIQESNDNKITSIQFIGYKQNYIDFLNSDNFEKDYIPNNEVNLLQSGYLIIPEIEKTFIIDRSLQSGSLTTIIIDENISEYLVKKDGTYYDMIVSDFIPSHYRIRSDRGDSSEKNKLKIKNYDENYISFETIFGTDTILDDGNIYIELIDEITNISVVKKIDIDRNRVLTSTTSSVSDEYVVSSIFFTDFDPNREIFWNPILTAPDGDLGISSKNNIVYLRLGSSRKIDSIRGFIKIGEELISINFQTQPDETQLIGISQIVSFTVAGISLNNNENSNNTSVLISNDKVAYVKLDFEKILGSIPEQNLQISSDIKVFDSNGSSFTIRL